MAQPRHHITPAGPAHPLVREYLNIKRNRGPRKRGVVAVEGLWALRAALDAEAPVVAVFVCRALVRGPATDEAVDRARCAGATVHEVSEKVLHRMVDRDGPDGVAAIARLPAPSLEDLEVAEVARVVVIDGVDLPGNIGTIVRASDGAGAAAVVVTNGRVRMTHPTLVKSSMGTVFSTPLIETESEALLRWLRRERFRVIAAHPDTDRSYRSVDYGGRIAVVLGNEREGLSRRWLDAADVAVSIPMLGVADSLNVGHAAALLLYEAVHGAGGARPRATPGAG